MKEVLASAQGRVTGEHCGGLSQSLEAGRIRSDSRGSARRCAVFLEFPGVEVGWNRGRGQDVGRFCRGGGPTTPNTPPAWWRTQRNTPRSRSTVGEAMTVCASNPGADADKRSSRQAAAVRHRDLRHQKTIAGSGPLTTALHQPGHVPVGAEAMSGVGAGQPLPSKCPLAPETFGRRPSPSPRAEGDGKLARAATVDQTRAMPAH